MILLLILTYLLLIKLKAFEHIKGSLCCGLVGFSGPTAPNILKLQTLGIINQSRGEQSCGMLLNNQIYLGTGQEALFYNFLSKKKVPVTFDKNNTVIIHTRKASVGTVSESNAHPFGFLNKPTDTEFSFIGAHNGTLSNWRDLLKDNNISPDVFNVDSEALLFILFCTKNFKVLSKYKGAAALLFSFLEEPNTLYAFRGAAGNKDERPMFYSKQEEGTYFSSIKESLDIVGNHNFETYELPANTVVKFHEGKIVEQFKIHRAEQLHPTYFDTSYGRNYVQSQIGFNNQNHTAHRAPVITPKEDGGVLPWQRKMAEHYDEVMKLYPEYCISRIYSFKNFRYYRNGHLFTGVISPKIEGLGNEDKIYVYEGVVVTDDSYKFLEKQSKTYKITEGMLIVNALYPIPKLIKRANQSITSTGQFWKGSSLYRYQESTSVSYPLVDLCFNLEQSVLKSVHMVNLNPQSEFSLDEYGENAIEALENANIAVKCELEQFKETIMNDYDTSDPDIIEALIKIDSFLNEVEENVDFEIKAAIESINTMINENIGNNN